ncbi:MAG: ATP-dependent Clp protease ATP-binding subunit ClpA [Pseudomonadota bacterium]|nr:ATP-dependent Clp protease ATP-binding subunit ClpA [Pseudomonadota bacterium]
MFDADLEKTLKHVRYRARTQQYEFLTIEQLLLALLDNESAAEVLVACGADLEKLTEELEAFIAKNVPVSDQAAADIVQTVGFDRVLQRAIFHAQNANIDQLSGAHLLIALFSEKDCYGVYLLKKQGITRLDVIQYISHEMGRTDSDNSVEQMPEGNPGKENLEEFAINLNAKAKKGKIDPLIGRAKELDRMAHILSRRRKNNPLLVGEAGVGKTAIVEGLARKIVEGDVPEPLLNATVFSLDVGSLLAGTKYRGDFEKRLKNILSMLKNFEHPILFIDEIHTIIGAGMVQGGTLDVSNLLKPMLANGELKCIGSTTYQEYQQIFDKDRALSRRFQKIDVKEPSLDEAVEILTGAKDLFEEYHGVKYTEDAIRAAVELSDRFIQKRHLPDKAVDVLDEAGAARKLANLKAENPLPTINEDDIEKVVATFAQIPSKQVSKNDVELLRHLKRNLKLTIFGQDESIDALDQAIKLSRSGLKEPGKPIANFLFSGPTGVGKTEVCRQLAKQLNLELVRFDMSEYMERHAVSRLIGAPPGYVGYDQAGLLTDAVNKTPHCIILLDEIEKAHPDIFNILLQVMDHGKLTDNNGEQADFRHAIIIMTTNAGAARVSRKSMGFMEQDHTSDSREEINRLFTPEFRNRLDAIVQFEPLGQEVIVHIVDKFITELQSQLDDKNVLLLLEDDVRNYLADHGYDKLMGARPMKRLIQEKLKQPLAEELLFGELAESGGEVLAKLGENGEIELVITPTQTAENDSIPETIH